MDAPDEIQKEYRMAALRILAQIEDAGDNLLTRDEKRDGLLYVAEALVDLAETMTEENPVGDRRD